MKKNKQQIQLFFDIIKEGNPAKGILPKLNNFNNQDWDKLKELALETGLFPCFYNRLINLKLGILSSGYIAGLKNIYIQNLQRNLMAERELSEIILALNHFDLKVMLLKGVFFAKYIYKDLSLRQASSDIDLLVKEEKTAQAEEALFNLGYKSCVEDETEFRRHNRQIMLSKAVNKNHFIVDLHWRIRGKTFPLSSGDLWNNANELKLDGISVFCPANEDLFLYLVCLAMFDGIFVKIKYLYDLHLFIKEYSHKTGWGRLIDRARSSNLETVSFYALGLCKDIFGTEILGEVFLSLRPGFLKEKILGLFIDRVKIVKINKNPLLYYFCHYFITSFMYSKNLSEYIKRTASPIFISFADFKSRNSRNSGFFSYLKRLFKPFILSLKKNHTF